MAPKFFMPSWIHLWVSPSHTHCAIISDYIGHLDISKHRTNIYLQNWVYTGDCYFGTCENHVAQLRLAYCRVETTQGRDIASQLPPPKQLLVNLRCINESDINQQDKQLSPAIIIDSWNWIINFVEFALHYKLTQTAIRTTTD